MIGTENTRTAKAAVRALAEVQGRIIEGKAVPSPV
jgi:hypothetical protein